MVLPQVHDTTTDHGSVLQVKIRSPVLVADFLVGMDDRFQQIVSAKLPPCGGKIRSDRSPFPVESMANITRTGTCHFAPISKITRRTNSIFQLRGEIVHFPIFHKGSGLKGKLRYTALGLSVHQFLKSGGQFCFRDGFDGVLFDVSQIICQTCPTPVIPG